MVQDHFCYGYFIIILTQQSIRVISPALICSWENDDTCQQEDKEKGSIQRTTIGLSCTGLNAIRIIRNVEVLVIDANEDYDEKECRMSV